MAKLPFLTGLGRFGRLPLPHDPERVDRVRDDLAPILDRLPASFDLFTLVDGVVGNSPYLTRLMLRDVDRLPTTLEQSPAAAMDAVLARARDSWRDAQSLSILMDRLRRAKADGAFIIGLADLAGVWSLDEVMARLSDLADTCLQAACSWLLRDLAARGRLDLPNPDDPQMGCGLTILAMGKHGARELNYSSDIDLAVYFDQDAMPVAAGHSPQDVSVALTRSLVKVMQEVTPQGYVFRTDLRLRPDPASTQVAVSFETAELYYEGFGQNWERAAYIKARAVAGDQQAGARFLALLHPFIWRKTLDYAAIEDIHSIKRQIHAHKGHGRITIEGHNIKLGRGGIREIEFYAQTQQLISGGRDPALREPTTIGALRALVAAGHVKGAVAEDLIESYRFLRVLEHRLQMVEDAQTHDLPRTAEGIAHMARFTGIGSEEAFRASLRDHLERVQHHYSELFESEPPLSKRSGSLVFTGVEDDPDTIDTLTRMGFQKPSVVTRTIRSWHRGHKRATRSTRSRTILTKLIPGLLEALSETSDPDGAFIRFDRFLEGLPYGVQVFSLLHAHPELLKLLVESLGMAPRFAEYLSRNPAILESMLDPGYLAILPGPRRLAVDLDASLAQARDVEDMLDRTRRFAREHGFRVGLQVLTGYARAHAAGRAHSVLADTVIRALLPHVEAQMAERHGRVPGGQMVVLGMGKLGSRELTAASDLDLILIYDHDGEAAASDGPVPLHASQYFARLSQRLINALTAPTAEGKFYEVDMRLRPSGRAGPIATRLDAFVRYHQDSAWTWERMALTRARVLAGPEELSAQVTAAVRTALCRADDPERIRADATDMRARMEREFGADNPWDVKTAKGGLIDLEFIAQVLQLVHGPQDPSLLHPTTRVALQRLAAAGHLAPDKAGPLIHDARLLQNIGQALTIAVDGRIDPVSASPALRLSLSRVTGSPSFATLESALVAAQRRVRTTFEQVIGAPGAGR